MTPVPDRSRHGASPIRLGVYEPWPRFDRAGLYRRIAADPRIDFTALFSSSAGVRPGSIGFGSPVAFDTDTLAGYESVFLRKADRTEHDGSFASLLDRDLPGELLKRRLDVLWLHGYYSASHLIAAATQLARGGKLLVREEQTLLHPRPVWKRALKRPLLRLLFLRSTGLFQGSRNREWFRHFGMPEERLFHVPICVDNDALVAEAQRLAPRRPELRAAFGIAPDAGPVILTVARLIPKKQTQVLLEAFRQVRSSRRCTLLIVGSGECEADLRRAIAEQGVPDVVFAGFLNQSEVPTAYAAADVFALASGWDETWGLVVNEAMNFGLPVVVSENVGCSVDLVRNGENGYVFGSGRADELAAQLARLIDEPEARERLGRAAAETVASWNYDAAAGELVAAIRSVVGPERWLRAA